MSDPFYAETRYVPAVLSLVFTTYLAAGAAIAQETPPPEGGLSLDLDVIAKQLDIARTNIQPSLGATVYDFGRQAIETQPQGDNQPLNRLLLQAPGVAQDSFGQLHVRNDHANLQFRINGVQLPEGINVFGQSLQTRLANSVALITGSLPAQYGLRTTGIIDIQTKTGTLDPGARRRSMAGSKARFSRASNGAAGLGRSIIMRPASTCGPTRESRTPLQPSTRSTTTPLSQKGLPMSPALSIRPRG